jgi:transcriptional regulator with XRE-family HTH domain
VGKKAPELSELGSRIRAARTAAGLTQEDLAYESEIDRSYIGGVERGERNLTFTMLCKVARALKCDLGLLTKGLPRRS